MAIIANTIRTNIIASSLDLPRVASSFATNSDAFSFLGQDNGQLQAGTGRNGDANANGGAGSIGVHGGADGNGGSTVASGSSGAPGSPGVSITGDVDGSPSLTADAFLHAARSADGAAELNPLLNYEFFGWLENRNPDPFFSGTYYAFPTSDLATTDFNSFARYLVYGIADHQVI
jgi:hypothetical protein